MAAASGNGKPSSADPSCLSEVKLFLSMRGHKPVGVNRHFQMACILDKYCRATNQDLSSRALWERLDALYDMEALHDSEILPFPNEVKDFELPESEFGELLAKYREADKDKASIEGESSKESQSSAAGCSMCADEHFDGPSTYKKIKASSSKKAKGGKKIQSGEKGQGSKKGQGDKKAAKVSTNSKAGKLKGSKGKETSRCSMCADEHFDGPSTSKKIKASSSKKAKGGKKSQSGEKGQGDKKAAKVSANSEAGEIKGSKGKETSRCSMCADEHFDGPSTSKKIKASSSKKAKGGKKSQSGEKGQGDKKAAKVSANSEAGEIKGSN